MHIIYALSKKCLQTKHIIYQMQKLFKKNK